MMEEGLERSDMVYIRPWLSNISWIQRVASQGSVHWLVRLLDGLKVGMFEDGWDGDGQVHVNSVLCSDLED